MLIGQLGREKADMIRGLKHWTAMLINRKVGYGFRFEIHFVTMSIVIRYYMITSIRQER